MFEVQICVNTSHKGIVSYLSIAVSMVAVKITTGGKFHVWQAFEKETVSVGSFLHRGKFELSSHYLKVLTYSGEI